MRLRTIRLLALLCLASCRHALTVSELWRLSLDEYARREENRAPVLAAMERTACMGECPVYRLLVREDGSVEFLGVGYVARPGQHRLQLRPEQLAEVRSVLARVQERPVEPRLHQCPNWAEDTSGVKLFVPALAPTTSFCAQGGFGEEQRAGLDGLGVQLDRIVASRRWVGRPVRIEPLFSMPVTLVAQHEVWDKWSLHVVEARWPNGNAEDRTLQLRSRGPCPPDSVTVRVGYWSAKLQAPDWRGVIPLAVLNDALWEEAVKRFEWRDSCGHTALVEQGD